MFDTTKQKIQGHVLIKDDLGNILVDKMNAIHFENISVALAKSLAHRPDGHIHEMAFGNGGATVSGVGTITYLTPNTTGVDAELHQETYTKVVDDQSPLNTDTTKNFIEVNHTTGNTYTDIVITCTLDFNEPGGQSAFDDATDSEGNYVFDELGIKALDGSLLTHVIFHPVQKSLNRLIEVIYTIRISVV